MPIYERPLLALLKVTLSSDKRASYTDGAEREITGTLTGIGFGYGSSQQGTDITAEVGDFTITMLDTSGRVWTVPDIHPGEMLRVRSRSILASQGDQNGYEQPNNVLFTGIVRGVSFDVDEDEDGELVKIITISGQDMVSLHANTNLDNVISAPVDAVEPGFEPFGLQIGRIMDAQKDPRVLSAVKTNGRYIDGAFSVDQIIYQL